MNQIHYILRWKPSANSSSSGAKKRLLLSGWGAGLDLKRVDYLTIDDRDISGQGQTQPVANQDSKVNQHVEAENAGRAGSDLFDVNDAQSNELIQLKGSQLQGSSTSFACLAMGLQGFTWVRQILGSPPPS